MARVRARAQLPPAPSPAGRAHPSARPACPLSLIRPTNPSCRPGSVPRPPGIRHDGTLMSFWRHQCGIAPKDSGENRACGPAPAGPAPRRGEDAAGGTGGTGVAGPRGRRRKAAQERSVPATRGPARFRRPRPCSGGTCHSQAQRCLPADCGQFMPLRSSTPGSILATRQASSELPCRDDDPDYLPTSRTPTASRPTSKCQTPGLSSNRHRK